MSRNIFLDVTQSPYNAIGDGNADDAAAIQTAIDHAAYTNQGGLVWLPPGVYKLGFGLSITQSVILAGAGWSTPPTDVAGTPLSNVGNGSWLSVDSTEFSPLTITSTARGCTIRDLAVVHRQPTNVLAGFGPVNYPYAIAVRADDVRIENVFLYNPTRGIDISNSTGSVGRVTLNRIWGQPFQEGIRIDNALDVIKIDNVHFWPFWSAYNTVTEYQRNNTNAILSYRNDNPHFSNIFVHRCNNGFVFSSSGSGATHGVTSKFHMMNVDIDFCTHGINIDGTGTTGQVANLTIQGTPGNHGIWVHANDVKLQGTNVRVTDVRNNGIRIEGSGTVAMLENVFIDRWNTSGAGFPGIEAVTPATVYLGRSRLFQGTGPETGGRGTFVLAK